MDEIKLSIITPAYNVEKYIKDLYEAIKVNLPYMENIEWVIVNDGSTDGTLELINTFNENWIKIITKKNGGLGSARTEGLEKSSGEYVWHMDADDFMTNNAFEEVKKILSSSEYDVIKVSDNHYDDKTKEIRPEKLYSIKKMKKAPHVWPQGLIVKRALFPRDFKFFPMNGDLAYMYIFDELDWNKFYLLNKRIVNYRVNIKGSMSTSKNVGVELRSSEYNFILYKTLTNEKYKKRKLKYACFDFAYALFINKLNAKKIKTPSYIKGFPFRFKVLINLVKLTPKLIVKMVLK